MIKKAIFLALFFATNTAMIKAMEVDSDTEYFEASENTEKVTEVPENFKFESDLKTELDTFLEFDQIGNIYDLIQKSLKNPTNYPVIGDWISKQIQTGHIFFLYLNLENIFKLIKNKYKIFYPQRNIQSFFKMCIILLIRVLQDVRLLQLYTLKLNSKLYDLFKNKINFWLNQLINLEPDFNEELLKNIQKYFKKHKDNLNSPATTYTYSKSWMQWIFRTKDYIIYGYQPNEQILAKIKKVNNGFDIQPTITKNYKKTFNAFIQTLEKINKNFKSNSEKWEAFKNIELETLLEKTY